MEDPRDKPPDKPRKKRVTDLPRAVKDRGSFIRELQRAARGRLDRHSPKH